MAEVGVFVRQDRFQLADGQEAYGRQAERQHPALDAENAERAAALLVDADCRAGSDEYLVHWVGVHTLGDLGQQLMDARTILGRFGQAE